MALKVADAVAGFGVADRLEGDQRGHDGGDEGHVHERADLFAQWGAVASSTTTAIARDRLNDPTLRNRNAINDNR